MEKRKEPDVAMNEKEIIRQHLKITGRVQGVGFRYRAKYAAANLGVTGWVKNEWDGSVEMEVQGTFEQINQLLKMLNGSRFIYIDWIERKEIPTEAHENGFHVR